MGTFWRILLPIAILVRLMMGYAWADQPPEHLSLECATCHDWHPGGDLPVDEACMGCHETWLPEHDAAAGVFHDPTDRSCSRCHGYHSTEMLKATGNFFQRPYGEAQVLRHCSSCHRYDNGLDTISDGHVMAAAQQYHQDSYQLLIVGLSEACMNCHDEDSENPDTPPATPAFPAHASHPIGLGIPPQSPWEFSGFREEIATDLELFDDQMECTTCHRIPAPTVFRLVPFPTVTDLCNGCHDMAPGLPGPMAANGPAINKLNIGNLARDSFSMVKK